MLEERATAHLEWPRFAYGHAYDAARGHPVFGSRIPAVHRFAARGCAALAFDAHVLEAHHRVHDGAALPVHGTHEVVVACPACDHVLGDVGRAVLDGDDARVVVHVPQLLHVARIQ